MLVISQLRHKEPLSRPGFGPTESSDYTHITPVTKCSQSIAQFRNSFFVQACTTGLASPHSSKHAVATFAAIKMLAGRRVGFGVCTGGENISHPGAG